MPIPSGPDLRSISTTLLARLDARTEKRRSDGHTIGERFAEERPHSLPLPAVPFRAASFHHVEVSRRSLITLAGATYSVWSDWARLPVKAFAGVDEIEIAGPDGRVVVHPRQPFGGRSVDYRHYLPELAKKPQAVRQVADELIRSRITVRRSLAPSLRRARTQASFSRLRARAPGGRRDR